MPPIVALPVFQSTQRKITERCYKHERGDQKDGLELRQEVIEAIHLGMLSWVWFLEKSNHIHFG